VTDERSDTNTGPEPEGTEPAGGYGSMGRRTGSRRPARSEPLPRSRLGENLRAVSPLPPLGRSLGEGFLATAGHLPILLLVLAFGPVYWLALLAAGSDHFPLGGMADVFALAPIGSLIDSQVADQLYGPSLAGLWFIVGAAFLRSTFVAVAAGWMAEAIEYRQVSPVGLLRGLRALRSVVAAHVLLVVTYILATNILLPYLGALGQLFVPVVLVGGIHLLAFVPAVAVREQRRTREVFRRSIRAALLPGGRHLVSTLGYFLLALVVFLPGARTSTFTANPPLLVWVFVQAGSLFHAVFLGVFTYRWMAVEDQVPDEPLRLRRERPPPRSRSTQRRR
jgi:hypothetical protein